MWPSIVGVPKANDCCNLDAVEQLTGFCRSENRRLPSLRHVTRTFHRPSRINAHDMSSHEPIEKHPNGSEMLLHRRSRAFRRQILDVRGDCDRADA